MSLSDLFSPLSLLHGSALKNRFMLAPLTTQQSLPDGGASKDDFEWLKRVAAGGFAFVQTCAATVQRSGKAFPGQLGIHDETHLPGLVQIADVIRSHGALSAVQLHHAGDRARLNLGGVPAPASDGNVSGFKGLTTPEVEVLRNDFVMAAQRADRAGFDGVNVHGAFGWSLSEFLSPVLNRRTDRYGGSLENRSRLIFEVIDGIRRTCNPQFQIGLRLSVERYGLRLEEIVEVAGEAMRRAMIDYIDLALWDSRQRVDDVTSRPTVLSLFAQLPRHGVRLGAAGKIMSGGRARELLDEGCDFVLIGRAAILESDFVNRVRNQHDHASPALPVSRAFLKANGLSAPFIDYLTQSWDGFVDQP